MTQAGNHIPVIKAASVKLDEERAAYDALPSWAREALRDAPHSFSAKAGDVQQLIACGPEEFRRIVRHASAVAWGRIWQRHGMEPPR